TDFDNRTLTYTHDPAGQLTTRINTLGEVTSYTRDTLGRITEKNAAGLITTYTHDASGNLQQAANPDATVTYTRDTLGRVTAETVNARTMTFTYDALGRRTSRTTPTGHTTTYTYDAAGNRTAMDIAGHVLTFDHDATGQELTRTIGDNLQLTHTWDPAGRLTSQSLTATGTGTAQTPHTAAAEVQNVLQRAYTYRPDGHLTAIDDSHTGRRTFDLDRAGRVTAVHATDWTETYAYDEAGNQTHATWPDRHPNSSARGERTYTGTNITRAGRIRYEHDALGRVTLRQKTRLSRKPDTWHYTWNTEDRLISVITPDGVTWRYAYDPLGRRIEKRRLVREGEAVDELIEFCWDGSLLAEQATCATAARPSVILTWDHKDLTPLTQVERKIAGSSLSRASESVVDQRFFSVITDLVGAPTELASESGDITWQACTTLWGAALWSVDASAYTPLRFPGQYFDFETSLHYNYFRFYDSTTGRYFTADPLGLGPAPNPRAYVSNPHSAVDYLGLSPCTHVAVDTNAVTDALSGAKVAEVDAAMAGRKPVLSPTAHRELLEGGHTPEAISDWLGSRGGRMGPAATPEGVSSIQNSLRSMWKGKSFNPMIADDDASVLHSAAQEGLSIITNDKRFYKNAERLGYVTERY
ncbi:RHS repeat-associated core domain-containing protein, partial [Streptomyces exfoliatus]|uniref:RHS repeat-associated core domain-containing protein n=3 Tax=Streptomyces TaxID=1883 RepID=UPI003C2E794B